MDALWLMHYANQIMTGCNTNGNVDAEEIRVSLIKIAISRLLPIA